MNIKEILKPRIPNIGTTLVIFILSFFFFNQTTGFGGPVYVRLPFVIKQTGCGTAPYQMMHCTFPWNPSGIVASIVFWVLVYIILSFVFSKLRKSSSDQ